MDKEKMTIELAKSESEQDVIDILKKYKLWDNCKYWRDFGDNENNWSTIGNQQAEADSALVEKIVNSVDALLMKECMIRGINPTSDEAPKSIADALEIYYGIRGGKIQNLTEKERTNLAQDNIILTSTGTKTCPNITIIDRGEGQSPYSMPNTILSINKSNKLKVPFVQGKFNMGGTGVLSFCGENNFQLIISKRCPDLVNQNDATHTLWGITLIRRERPSKENGLRSSKYTYLTDTSGNIFSFEKKEGLEIIPTSNNEYKSMHYGMFCKMYEYKLPGRLRSNINMNLYTRLSMLLPNLAYPVYLDECRKGYTANTLHRTLSGLNVRLSDQLSKGKDSNIEKHMPSSFMIEGQKVNLDVYVFKKENGIDKNGKNKKIDLTQYRDNEGIFLVQNGQTHGCIDRRFYSRKNVNLSYLSEYLLTIVDCSNIDEATREELFMNSRDRTRTSLFAKKLEEYIEEYLKDNPVLKEIQQKRREEAISEKLDDEKPLEDVLASIFKSSSVLSKLFIAGQKLQNPINLGKGHQAEKFIGKYNPTFFTMIKKKNKETENYIKEVNFGRKFRIQFKTDAVNDFFSREDYPGDYKLICDGELCDNYIINLHDGIANLNVELQKDAKVGGMFSYKFIVTDTNNNQIFENNFSIIVIPEKNESIGGMSSRIKPNGNDIDKNTISPMGISLPKVLEIDKDKWNEHGFNKESALDIKRVDNEYDFFVNMDNIHLLNELNPISKDENRLRLMKARYKYSMVLVGLGVLGYCNNHKQQNIDSEEDMVRLISDMMSPIILPMISVLGDDTSDIYF